MNNTAAWYSGTITANETWTSNQVNIVYGTVTVASGVALTIQPGAIVKFAAGAGLQIVLQSGATLNAPATQVAPIILTSLNDNSVGGDTNGEGNASIPTAGDWSGFVVDSGANLNFSQYVEVRYLLQTISGTLTDSETLVGNDAYLVTSTVVVPRRHAQDPSRGNRQVRPPARDHGGVGRAVGRRRDRGPADRLHFDQR